MIFVLSSMGIFVLRFTQEAAEDLGAMALKPRLRDQTDQSLRRTSPLRPVRGCDSVLHPKSRTITV